MYPDGVIAYFTSFAKICQCQISPCGAFFGPARLGFHVGNLFLAPQRTFTCCSLCLHQRHRHKNTEKVRKSSPNLLGSHARNVLFFMLHTCVNQSSQSSQIRLDNIPKITGISLHGIPIVLKPCHKVLMLHHSTLSVYNPFSLKSWRDLTM